MSVVWLWLRGRAAFKAGRENGLTPKPRNPSLRLCQTQPSPAQRRRTISRPNNTQKNNDPALHTFTLTRDYCARVRPGHVTGNAHVWQCHVCRTTAQVQSMLLMLLFVSETLTGAYHESQRNRFSTEIGVRCNGIGRDHIFGSR